MPHLKGTRDSAGYIRVNEHVNFLKSVKFANDWAIPYYVDNNNGSDGYDGLSPSQALLNLSAALTKAVHGDIIYIRPKTPDYAGGDPGVITPATAANWSITYGKYGLSLVGTGQGQGAASAQQTILKGHATPTTPVLDIKAAYCNIENLGFKKGTNTTDALVRSAGIADYYVFGTTIYGCWFRIGPSAGAFVTDSSWYDHVVKTTFSGCPVGIQIGASLSVPVGIVIRDCDFDGLIAEILADIKTSGAVAKILMTKLNFNHVLPTGGSPNKYVNIAAASTGLISDSYFGVADATIANSLTLNGIGNSHLWGASAEIT